MHDFVTRNSHGITKTPLTILVSQFIFSLRRITSWISIDLKICTIPKKSGKKKSKASEVNLDVEIIFRTEITFEDTKAIIGADQEFKWGEIYEMIRYQNIPDAGLE